jgi:hypothetical protein
MLIYFRKKCRIVNVINSMSTNPRKSKSAFGKLTPNRFRWPRGLRLKTWLRGYWDHGYESRSGYACLFLCFCVVLSCRGLCDGLITRPEESYRVSKYDHAEGEGKPLH